MGILVSGDELIDEHSTVVAEKKKLTVGYHVPDDKDLLAALGEISIRHGHLDHTLKMMIRSFTEEVTPQEVMDATARETSWSLRDRVKKLARSKLGEGAALVKVQALLERSGRLTDRRNALIHILCGKDNDGNPVAATNDLKTWEPLPTVAALHTLSADMQKLINEILQARGKWGFISVALLDIGTGDAPPPQR
jgi:hypothetical protein